MQRIERSERMSRETIQQIARADSVAIFQRVNLKEAICDIFLKRCDYAAFGTRVDLVVTPAAAQ